MEIIYLVAEFHTFTVCSEAFLQQNKHAFIFLNKCNILFHLALL